MTNEYVRPAVIIFLCSFGLAGPTWPCCASNGAGSSFASLYSSLIFTASRIRVLCERQPILLVSECSVHMHELTSSRHLATRRRHMRQIHPMCVFQMPLEEDLVEEELKP